MIPRRFICLYRNVEVENLTKHMKSKNQMRSYYDRESKTDNLQQKLHKETAMSAVLSHFVIDFCMMIVFLYISYAVYLV